MQVELRAREQGSNTLRVCHASSLEGAEAGPESLKAWLQDTDTKGVLCKQSCDGLPEGCSYADCLDCLKLFWDREKVAIKN